MILSSISYNHNPTYTIARQHGIGTSTETKYMTAQYFLGTLPTKGYKFDRGRVKIIIVAT